MEKLEGRELDHSEISEPKGVTYINNILILSKENLPASSLPPPSAPSVVPDVPVPAVTPGAVPDSFLPLGIFHTSPIWFLPHFLPLIKLPSLCGWNSISNTHGERRQHTKALIPAWHFPGVRNLRVHWITTGNRDIPSPQMRWYHL